ncbi:hypothetical protein PPYR_11588 [Photinus pyralis]|uniref:DNA replication complex GINS protein PSF2 n=1 Tax=Photinus pyralis TaxID=7054 RepID=A0A1Y1M4S0_PHOPY|nr:probable DNA replication complex GINS protein PSF2 [Photinus pyralis]XP_031350212.1 probable DNA replication complex GINS protein PSF2 [Photinus pyralis]KAB0794749.1 hypothetical protein PPYR_11588 [Photinus pyralis]
MNPEEVEFLGEKQLISIIPTFNSSTIHLVSGDIGPFRASLPVNVPLWVAVNLKQQRKCKIQPPDWMDVEQLELLKEAEKASRNFVKMPSEHYMIEGKLLLSIATDDIARADEVRTIIKDIWDIRMAKLRSSVNTLITGKSYGNVDNLTIMEINSMRPLIPHAMDQIHRMKMERPRFSTPSQSTSLGLLNSSTVISTFK